jgi:broad specificity phosphatase PhoE
MEAVRPKRKSRIRLLPVIGYVIVVLGLAWFFEQQATTTIIFVRHAEVEATAGGGDPELSAAGRRRAEALADFVANIDVVQSVDAIYATTSHRTQATAMPLAMRLGLTLNIDDPYRVERFMRRVMRDRRGKITLIVTDGDAIAPLIDELHGSKRLPPFGPADFGELYVVTIPYYGKVKTLRFHYGDAPGVQAQSEQPPAEATPPGAPLDGAATSLSSPQR